MNPATYLALVLVLAAYYDWLGLSKVSRPLWVLIPVVLILAPGEPTRAVKIPGALDALTEADVAAALAIWYAAARYVPLDLALLLAVLAVVLVLIFFVQAIQSLGDWAVRRLSHR